MSLVRLSLDLESSYFRPKPIVFLVLKLHRSFEIYNHLKAMSFGSVWEK